MGLFLQEGKGPRCAREIQRLLKKIPVGNNEPNKIIQAADDPLNECIASYSR
jgi:hypothetical protein